MKRGLLTFGETMGLLRASEVGPLQTQSAFSLSTGGAESNVAIGVRRLGVPATWVGVVGSDPVGERVLRDLHAESVEVLVRIADDATTGLMLKERRLPGRNRVTYARNGSAGSYLEMADLPDELGQFDVLHVTGITAALSRSSMQTVLGAVGKAKEQGALVSFDVNHRPALWKNRHATRIYQQIAARADIVFASEDEVSYVVPNATSTPEAAALIAAMGPTQVIIKRGSEGAMALVDGEFVVKPAISILPVDTVGAGDGFVAGYLAELILGTDLDSQLDTAVRAGAFACMNLGDWEGAPRRIDLPLVTALEPVVR